MRILLGVSGMGQQEAKIFVDSANAIGADIRSYETKFSKLGIEQYLETHPDTDVVIVSEWLETKATYEVSDFEKMIEANENLRIIPILGANAAGADKVKGLFNLGIYTALYAKDASAEQVARMITEGRTRKAAKAYYNIQDSDGSQFGANIQQCVTFICEDGLPDGILDRAQYVKDHVELSDYQIILSRLPEDVIEVIRDAGEGLVGVTSKEPPQKKDTEEKDDTAPDEKNGGVSAKLGAFVATFHKPSLRCKKVKKGGMESEGIQNPAVIESGIPLEQMRELLVNVTVAFVGTQKRIGCTHQAIIAAHYLAKAGYRVAIADCTKTKGKVFDAIRKYMSVSTGRGFFTYNGVDYYSNAESGMNDIFLANEKYNFIIIDYGAFDRVEKEAFAKTSVKCVVAGAMPWELGALNSFMMEAKAFSNECNYIIRGVGVAEGAVDAILGDRKYLTAEIQQNPFSGECYTTLKEVFEPYIGGRMEVVPEAGGKGIFPKKRGNFRKAKTRELSDGEKIKKIGTASVYVTSLKHGCGNSHFSVAAANYLSRRGYAVCMVSDMAGVREMVDEQIETRKTSELIDDLYAESDYMVFDEGVYSELSGDQLSQCKRADYKIMMCWADDDYMAKLASFVSKQKDDAEHWIFMFNNVPDRKISEVQRIMNLYLSCFLPSFEAEDPDKETRKILKEVLG